MLGIFNARFFLDHRNIVKFTDVYEDKHFLYVIMELCSGGEIFDKLIKMQRFTESDMKSLCMQIFSAVEYIHSLSIIHRDVKAENFLFAADGSIKLIDFGLAVRLKHDNEFLKEIVGSAHYIAPEMLDRKYSKSVDIWSAGVLVFLMIHGRYPFDAETDDQILRKIKLGSVDGGRDSFKPSDLVTAFITRLLERDPIRRLSATSALQDAFLLSTSDNSSIIISEEVVDNINKSIVIPEKGRKLELLESESERIITERIHNLTKQFELGTHRGWKKSRGPIKSAPVSPKSKLLNRQGTKGLPSPKSALKPPITPYPREKRAKSLPGSFRVHFDANPPDIFVYGDTLNDIRKISPNTPISGKKLIRKGTVAI